ncbi:hypothetical protein RUM44_005566 [Polyplax serrata]|uniref:Cap-specific mRNA (nucleoside-2'-O-)-methyltransferase 1 n=1 Tax=Polyplax serrata TaxID=468196 RepID=A0ABR1ADS2_POLSC
MNNEFEENDGSPHPKKRKINFGQNYMQKFGFKDGSGLGRNADGIVEPVEVSKQKGTRGLGYTVAALEGARISYNPSEEKNLIHEDVPQWLENNHDDSISKEILVSWMKKGPQMKRLSDESEFCSPGVPKKVFTSKDVLSHISEKDVKAGRRRANPYESISHAIFLNRAAMKMANMDAVLDRMFTKPKNINGEDAIANGDLLYFADVCAGPGGFSEFVFHMKKWRAKGFGFTLRKENDFKLDDFLAGPSETFHPYYGSKGDGDIYDTDNVESFVEYVMRQTNSKGVHFMMADGGMPIEMKNDQELICKKLYLCQCLVAMKIVRTGGHFVLKLYDLFTNFSVGLIYLMFRSFKYILIMKPRTSRPANSERIAKLQIFSLNKLAVFCEDEDLKDDRQQQLRKLCLDEWGIPDEARAEPKKTDVQSKCRQLTGASTLHNFETNMKDILIENLATFPRQVRSVYDWQMVLLRSKNDKFTSGFYISLGKKNIWQYVQNGWHKLSDVQHFVLPADTLVYGEIVEETQGEGKSQMKYFAFHIIDGLFLGGEDIRNRNLDERLT